MTGHGNEVCANMGDRVLPGGVIAWLALSTIICFWDGSFILLRPYSSKGGSLNFLYKPYNIYDQVDKRYADMTNSYVIGQSWMNIVENFLNIITLILHMQKKLGPAMVMACVVLSMTFSKTVLYFLTATQLCNGAHYVNHNSWPVFIGLYIIPNGFWIVLPFLCLVNVARCLVACVDGAAAPKKD